jgi:hypothetical protein
MRVPFPHLFFTVSLAIVFSSNATETVITASKPTHYFYTPASYVNPPFNLVLGLHEISFSFPGNLQLEASLFDNVGRLNRAAKSAFIPALSVGAGLAHTIVHLPTYKAHGIPAWAQPRFGAFLCWGFVTQSAFEAAVTAHSQIGDHFSLGADLGLNATPQELWSIIWELGTSVDVNDNALYLNTDGGVRFHPREIPFLNFDVGVDLQEFRVQDHPDISATVYVDVLFAMVVR